MTTTIPTTPIPAVDPEALAHACRLVSTEWGDTGYVIVGVGAKSWRDEDVRIHAATVDVVHYDGSRFQVSADQFGNELDECGIPRKATR